MCAGYHAIEWAQAREQGPAGRFLGAGPAPGDNDRMRALAVVAAVLAASAARAHAGDPTQVWRTVETEHFQVHYHEPLGAVARRVALSAERAHATLTRALRNTPEGQTHIVVVDDTDGSNGFASVLPRNDITLYTSAPPDTSALGDHDDWLYNLTSHEYTHIVHLDTIEGLPRLYNRVFGKQWSPNQLQPRWVIEGLATYEESKRSASGRTRHALFDMQLRIATLRGNDRRLDEISSGPRQWPHGNAAYLHGSHFLKYIFDRYGDDKAAEMSHFYGRFPIPYALNRSIHRSTGRTFIELFDEWQDYRRARYGLQAEAVERMGRREGRRLTFTGENNLNPHYTRDGGAIIWQRGDGYSDGHFRSMPRDDNAGRSTRYAYIERSGAFDVLSDGSMVVEQTQTYRTSYEFQELQRWDRATGVIEPLTHGMRVSDPDVSPDERTVAFVVNGQSRRRLAVMPLHREATPRIVWTGPSRWDQAFSPDWSPDGKSIAFSAWRTGGHRDILIVDVATGRVREVSHDRAQDSEPTWSPDGAYVYFNSDRTGIYNIYAFEVATGAVWQVTDVLGCALSPSVSPDGKHLVYQGFDKEGYELYEIALDPARWTPAPPYIDDRPDPVEVRADEFAVSPPRPYRALDTLPPNAYTIGLASNTLGNTLQLSTAGADVVGHHGYQLATTIGLDYEGINIGGSYSYRRLWPSLSVAASRSVASRGGYIVDGMTRRFREEALRGSVSAGLPVMRAPDADTTLALDYDVDWLRNLDGQLEEEDPNDSLPRVPETDAVFAGLALRMTYTNTRGYNYTVGPQAGQDLTGAVRLDHPALGADSTTLSATYRGTWYRQIPFVSLPVIAFRLSGGIRTSNRDRVEDFAVGGVPDSQDIVRSLVDNLRASTSGYLRGYPNRFATGNQFHLANLEIRQLFYDVERGIDTLPAYLRRIHGAALVDAGNAFDGPIDLEDFKLSVGAVLRIDATLGYGLPATLELGYARGLTEGGVNETWLLLTSTL